MSCGRRPNWVHHFASLFLPRTSPRVTLSTPVRSPCCTPSERPISAGAGGCGSLLPKRGGPFWGGLFRRKKDPPPLLPAPALPKKGDFLFNYTVPAGGSFRHKAVL